MEARRTKVKAIVKSAILTTSLLFGAWQYTEAQEAKAELSEAEDALTSYEATYDGLRIFEDGSWTYREGVEPYYFWNPEWQAKHPAVVSGRSE